MSKPATLPQAQQLLKLVDDTGVTNARLQSLFSTGLLAGLFSVRDPDKIDREAFRTLLEASTRSKHVPVLDDANDLPAIDIEEAFTVSIAESGVDLLRHFGVTRDPGYVVTLNYPQFEESWAFAGSDQPIVVSLFEITKPTTTNAIYAWMAREGFRPAKLYELAAVAKSSEVCLTFALSLVSLETGVLRNRSGDEIIQYPGMYLDHHSTICLELIYQREPYWDRGWFAIGVKIA